MELAWLVEGCLPRLESEEEEEGPTRSDYFGSSSSSGVGDDSSDDDLSSVRDSKGGGVRLGYSYHIPHALAVGLMRELAERGEGAASGGMEGSGLSATGDHDGGSGPSVAAYLAEYISRDLLRKSIDL